MAGNFAEVYLNLETSQISSPFDYLVPDRLSGDVKVGSLVLIPFGRRLETGFVKRIKSSSFFKESSGGKIKEIKDILFSKPFFDLNRLKLAYWLSFYYVSPMSSVLRLFMPPGYNLKINRFVFFEPEGKTALLKEFPFFLDIMLEEELSEKDLIEFIYKKQDFSGQKIKSILLKMEKEKYIKIKYRLSETKIKPRFANIYDLNFEKFKDHDSLPVLKNSSQRSIIDYIKGNPESLKETIIINTGATDYGLNALVDRGLIIKKKKVFKRDFNYDNYLKNSRVQDKIKLNAYQENCVNKITDIIGKNIQHSFLIEGVTGSGKTEVYIRCVGDAIKKNKSALILTPEISLTPQLYSNFKNVFKNGLAVYHSGMSENERFEKWIDILNGEIKIIIGTRSAIFTPITDLGIIIIDEEQDTSYKENSGVRYNTIDTAIRLSKILKIPVVFGSATPSISLKYKLASAENSTVLSMPEKIYKDKTIIKQIVDLKKINKNFEDEIITNQLFDDIKKSIDKNEKVIIFINRRGYSNFVICNDCGFIPKCPNCDLSYTFHINEKKLKCHHCGAEEVFTYECPSCKSRRVSLYGTGIQKVESKLKQRFPQINIIRMDSDMTSKKKSHEEILNRFINQSPSILIGTQMVSKGLDIEDVTLVGIINIDGMLSLPDYHMNERAFSLLTQVSGRTGRSNKQGKVTVQTFRPDSIIIRNFINDGYANFYDKELENRKELDYPPFSNLINIIVSCKIEEKAKLEIYRLFSELKPLAEKYGDKLLGPSPSPFIKLNQYYRWHILIKTFKINRFIGKLAKLTGNIKIDKECRLIVDVDPVWIL
ncbi:MAG: primosomal protein N' [Actinobacteria bacterium]|nr:primosomal protein N' [Actinomycetota bacterium]